MKSLLDKLEALLNEYSDDTEYFGVVIRDDLRAIINEAKEKAQEPFGYFKAEPFGWTDCAEADEGAVALYEYPSIPAGYALVPLEPTEGMVRETDFIIGSEYTSPRKMYKAMIAAAIKGDK